MDAAQNQLRAGAAGRADPAAGYVPLLKLRTFPHRHQLAAGQGGAVGLCGAGGAVSAGNPPVFGADGQQPPGTGVCLRPGGGGRDGYRHQSDLRGLR